MKPFPAILVLLSASSAVASVPNWPQFRGPNSAGVAEVARPPIEFGPGTNLLWKIVRGYTLDEFVTRRSGR